MFFFRMLFNSDLKLLDRINLLFISFELIIEVLEIPLDKFPDVLEPTEENGTLLFVSLVSFETECKNELFILSDILYNKICEKKLCSIL